MPIFSGGGSGGSGAGGLTRLSDTLLLADTANFDITGISASFTQLMLYLYLRATNAGNFDFVTLRINGDTGVVYYAQEEHSATTSVASSNTIGNNNPQFGFCPGNTAPAGVFGALVVQFPNYAATTGNKVCVAQNLSVHANTSGNVQQQASGIWYNSSTAVSRLTIYPATGPNWLTGSRATLYGLT